MKKLLLAIICCMLGSAVLANPTAVCSGPDEVSGNIDDEAHAFYTVRRSYDYQDHNLEKAIKYWSISGDGCASIGATLRPLDIDRGPWDRVVHFNVDTYVPLFCTIAVAMEDGSTSTCSINVRVASHCETFSGDTICIRQEE